MADPFLNGMDWELEHGATTMLRISGEEADCGKLIPYQFRMMQEQAMDRLLPLAVEEADGRMVLHYDLTGKRRLVQRLYAEPLSFRRYVELAHRLVRAVAECRQWMLHESGFVLHEDFIYAGRKPGDFRLCYLPLEGATDGRIMPPVTSRLRRLLLRLLAFVKEPVPQEMAPVFALLSQEPYAIVQLEQALRKLRYGGIGKLAEEERDNAAGKGFASPGAKRFSWLNRRGDAWLDRRNGAEQNGLNGAWLDRWFRKGRKVGRRGGSHAPAQSGSSIQRNPLSGKPISGVPPAGNPVSSGGRGASGIGGFGNGSNIGDEKTGLLDGGAVMEQGEIRLVFSGAQGTETREMDTDRFLIGRKPDSVHYTLTSEGVSRIHCEIVRQADGLTAADLGSLNGTMLNGEVMLPYKQYLFRQGDVLQVAGTTIRLEAPASGFGAEQVGARVGVGESAANQ